MSGYPALPVCSKDVPMKADPLTTVKLFEASARYLVPLFQRPYVWTEKNQWAPLWDDVRSVAERVLAVGPQGHVPAHFLGAVVVEPITQMGLFYAQWNVIDGQQRLTTLQLLLDASELVVRDLGDAQDAEALRLLVVNHNVASDDEARFKVWPTNKDRDAFAAAMDDVRPVPTSVAGSRIVQAHTFFVEQVRGWAQEDGPANTKERLHALVVGLRDRLSVVGIQLEPGDNAQVIFETLNFRGAPLLAADLVKNHLFQRLEQQGGDTDKLYEKYWSELDEDYWREPVVQGRLTRPRIDIFLSRWMVMKLVREVASDRVFADFRDEVTPQYPNASDLMRELHDDATAYREFLSEESGTPQARFRYHVLEVLNSNVVMPVVLWFITRGDLQVPKAQEERALQVLDSYITRRAVVKLGTKDLNHLVIEILERLNAAEPHEAADVIEDFLLKLPGPSRVWPDDDYLKRQLREMRAYRVLRRDVNRMLLEAVEEAERWKRDVEETLAPKNLSVEHVMPQAWSNNWPLSGNDPDASARREDLIQTLGNLTLVKGNHNSSMSNNAWSAAGGKGKREYLQAHTSLFMNQTILSEAQGQWTEQNIEERGARLAGVITSAWPRPAGGPRTEDVLRSTQAAPRPEATSQPTYELTGPGWMEQGLSRRMVVPKLVEHLRADGVSMPDIASRLPDTRVESVEGLLNGDELWDALLTIADVQRDQRRVWAVEEAIHEGGRTWVLAKFWGNAVDEALDSLTGVRPGYSSSTHPRPRARWSVADVVDALVDTPDVLRALEELVSTAESVGGRAGGTAARTPSLVVGVPAAKGMAWPYSVYTDDLDRVLYLYLGSVNTADGVNEEFLARLEKVLPELDGAAVRVSGMAKRPSIGAETLARPGVAKALGEALAVLAVDATTEQRWWGIHNNALTAQELLADGFVSIGWDAVPDLREVGYHAEVIDRALRASYPDEAPGAYPNWVAILRKFAFELRPGDMVVAPDKGTRTVNIGRVSGGYWYEPSAPVHRHRLPVEWLVAGVGRDHFSQAALNEIGSALTLFRVQSNVEEFEQALGGV